MLLFLSFFFKPKFFLPRAVFCVSFFLVFDAVCREKVYFWLWNELNQKNRVCFFGKMPIECCSCLGTFNRIEQKKKSEVRTIEKHSILIDLRRQAKVSKKRLFVSFFLFLFSEWVSDPLIFFVVFVVVTNCEGLQHVVAVHFDSWLRWDKLCIAKVKKRKTKNERERERTRVDWGYTKFNLKKC